MLCNQTAQAEIDVITFASPMFIITKVQLANQIASLQTIELLSPEEGYSGSLNYVMCRSKKNRA